LARDKILGAKREKRIIVAFVRVVSSVSICIAKSQSEYMQSDNNGPRRQDEYRDARDLISPSSIRYEREREGETEREAKRRGKRTGDM